MIGGRDSSDNFGMHHITLPIRRGAQQNDFPVAPPGAVVATSTCSKFLNDTAVHKR